MDKQPFANLSLVSDEYSEDEEEEEMARKEELHRLLNELPDDGLFDDTVSSSDTTIESNISAPPSAQNSPEKGLQSHGHSVPLTKGLDVFAGTSQAYTTQPRYPVGVVKGGISNQGSYLQSHGSGATNTAITPTTAEGRRHGDEHSNPGNTQSSNHGHRGASLIDQLFDDHHVVDGGVDSTRQQFLQNTQQLPKLIQPLPLLQKPHPEQPRQYTYQLQSQPPPLPPSSQPSPLRNPPSTPAHEPLPASSLATSPPDNRNYSLKQLEVLYKARGRQVAELTQKLSSVSEDGERHVRILREEKELLGKDRAELCQCLEELQSAQEQMEGEMSTLRGSLEAERTRSKALEGSKSELMSRLVSAEATIHGLTKEVEELHSSESIGRVRESYSSALSQAAHRHTEQVALLREDLGMAREEIETKNNLILKLNQEIRELQPLQHVPENPLIKPNIQPPRHADGVVQQLRFGVGGGGGGGEDGSSEVERRVLELATLVEDLTYQLSTRNEELEEAVQRGEIAEATLSKLSPQLSEAQSEIEVFSGKVSTLRHQLETFEVEAESAKKAALEQCRTACLKLHEDAIRRLKESTAAEKVKITQDLTRQISQLRISLAAVQDEYVCVCRDKDGVMEELKKKTEEIQIARGELEKVREEGERRREEMIHRAVEEARKEWNSSLHDNRGTAGDSGRGPELDDIRKLKEEHSVEVGQLRAELRRMEGEGEERKRRAYEELEGEKKKWEEEAVRRARMEWLKEKEMSIQRRIETAVDAAQKLWKLNHQSSQLMDLSHDSPHMANHNRSHPPASPPPKPSLQQPAYNHNSLHPPASPPPKPSLQQPASNHNSLHPPASPPPNPSLQQPSYDIARVLASEKAKWLKEQSCVLKERERDILALAQRQWHATWDAAKNEEINIMRRKFQESYELKCEEARKNFLKQYDHDTSRLAQQVCQLEERLATCLQEQDRSASHLVVRGGRGISAGGIGRNHFRKVIEMTTVSVKEDVIALVREMEEKRRCHHEREIREVREATTRQVKKYYLQCLHQLINTNKQKPSHERSHDFNIESHDFTLESCDLAAAGLPLGDGTEARHGTGNGVTLYPEKPKTAVSSKKSKPTQQSKTAYRNSSSDINGTSSSASRVGVSKPHHSYKCPPSKGSLYWSRGSATSKLSGNSTASGTGKSSQRRTATATSSRPSSNGRTFRDSTIPKDVLL